MADILAGAEKLREILSPEGVEEQVVFESTTRVTRTLGGKFRTYTLDGDSKGHDRSFANKDEAMRDAGMSLMVLGGLLADPKGTIDLLLASFKADRAKE